MVSNLKYYERDPMFPEKNRGSGWYYFRGHLSTGLVGGQGTRNPQGFRGAYFSKFTPRVDGKKPHLPTKVVTSLRHSEELLAHKGDFKTRKASAGPNSVKAIPPRAGYIRNRKTTRYGEGYKGYY